MTTSTDDRTGAPRGALSVSPVSSSPESGSGVAGSRRTRLIVLSLLALALLWRLLYFGEILASPYGNDLGLDSAVHHQWAVAMAEGQPAQPGAFFRAPLYPAALSLVYRIFGPSQEAAKLSQILISCISCWLIYRIAREVFDEAVGLTALLMSACYGMLLYFANELLIVTLILFLDLLAILLILRAVSSARWGYWFSAGVVLGLSAIARPNVLAFVVLLPLWMLVALRKSLPPRRLALAAAALALGCALPIAPVTFHNFMAEGDLVLIASQGGVNFYIGNNPHSDGVTAVVPGTRDTFHEGYEDQVRIARQALRDPHATSAAISAYWYGRGLAYIRENPTAALGHTLYKAFILFNAYEIGNNRVVEFVTRHSRVFTYGCLRLWLVLPLAVAGLVLGAARRPRVSLLLLFAGSYLASFVPFFVSSRFRMPVIPVFILLAAFAVVESLRRVKGQSQLRAALADRTLLVAITLAVITAVVIRPIPAVRNTDAQGYFNEGEGYRHQGRYAEAGRSYEKAIGLEPGFAGAYTNLAKIHLLVHGDPERALEILDQGLRHRPDDPLLLYNAAVANLDIERFGRARTLLVRAVAVDPGNPSVRLALGYARERLGHDAEALTSYRTAARLDPGSAATWSAAGRVALKLGRPDEARTALERSLALDPSQADVWAMLARARTTSGATAHP